MDSVRAIDPIGASLVSHLLSAAAREMGLIMERSTSSRYFQIRDMSTSIMDRNARLIGQAEYIPLMTFALRPQLISLLSLFGSDITDGDYFVASDVYYGGNQALDLAVFRPVFYEGTLVFWTATKGHVSDLGGAVAGGYNLNAVEVWQENVRIPPLRIARGGKRLADVWEMLLANSRTPDLLARDTEAMIAGCDRGAERLIQHIEGLGTDVVMNAVEDLISLSAAAVRREVQMMRPGTYRSEALLSDDGSDEHRQRAARLRTEVHADGRIDFDFAGTDKQVYGITNSPLATTVSSVFCALFMCISSEIPHNEGCLRHINVMVPEGTFLNPSSPAAAQTGNFTANNVVTECVLKALAQAAPEGATAGWSKAYGSTLSCINPLTERLEVESAFFNNKGGSGATHGYDGFDHIGPVILGGGTFSNDYERFERQNPYRLIEHELWEDSGGAGEWRGGLGTRSGFVVEAERVTISVHGDNDQGAHGANSGRDAPPNRYVFVLPDGTEVVPGGISTHTLPRSTLIRNWNGGGGGYGDPRRRERNSLQRDLKEGLVSLSAARDIYGWSVQHEEGDSL